MSGMVLKSPALQVVTSRHIVIPPFPFIEPHPWQSKISFARLGFKLEVSSFIRRVRAYIECICPKCVHCAGYQGLGIKTERIDKYRVELSRKKYKTAS